VLLSSTSAEVLEVVIAGGLVVLVMGVMVSIPFLVEYFFEERRRAAEE
jgi:hypothetical protein